MQENTCAQQMQMQESLSENSKTQKKHATTKVKAAPRYNLRTPGQNFHVKKSQFSPKKAFQLTFRTSSSRPKLLKKIHYPLSKNGPEKFIPLNPCCPQGI
jgi:hypothetical protein